MSNKNSDLKDPRAKSKKVVVDIKPGYSFIIAERGMLEHIVETYAELGNRSSDPEISKLFFEAASIFKECIEKHANPKA